MNQMINLCDKPFMNILVTKKIDNLLRQLPLIFILLQF